MIATVESANAIRPTTIATLQAHGGDLFRSHYEEIARNKGVMVLNPHWQRYEQAEAAGMLFALAAWVGTELVGYAITIVDKHLHYSALTYAQNDVIYVAKPHRRGSLGASLIHATEAEATRRGAKLMLWHAKQGTALEALLPRLGYGVQDIIFSREIK